ncbi:hypothetical protein PR048_009376, partial [Dryococelus australis]
MQELVKILLPKYFQHLREIESHLKIAKRKATITVLTCAVKEKLPSSFFSACSAHSLNRVGVNAAKICPEVVTFFVKQSETRWSERFEAVLPIAKHYPGILKALDYILQQMSTTVQPKIYSTVLGLKKYFSSFERLVMAVFWYKLLSCIGERSVIIQTKGIYLEVEYRKFKNNLQESRLVAQEMELPPVFFSFEKRNRLHSIGTPHVCEQYTVEDKFKTCIVYRVLISFLQELEDRFKAANSFCELCSPHTSSVVFESEIEVDPLKLLNSICEKNLEPVFMNVCNALRLFRTLLLTVASAEGAFSKLGNVLKTWQRVSMSQQRINSLSLQAIEHSLASTLDFANVINKFANNKAKKN